MELASSSLVYTTATSPFGYKSATSCTLKIESFVIRNGKTTFASGKRNVFLGNVKYAFPDFNRHHEMSSSREVLLYNSIKESAPTATREIEMPAGTAVTLI